MLAKNWFADVFPAKQLGRYLKIEYLIVISFSYKKGNAPLLNTNEPSSHGAVGILCMQCGASEVLISRSSLQLLIILHGGYLIPTRRLNRDSCEGVNPPSTYLRVGNVIIIPT